MASRRRTASIGALLLCTGATLVVSLAIQLPCRRLCFGDIQGLYERRAVTAGQPPYLRRPLEYPVGIGAVMWIAALPATSSRSAFLWSVVLLGAAALATTWLLARHRFPRAWRFAAAPPLALYAFHNWDVLPVLATVAGIVAFTRRRTTWAGVWFGLGSVMKLYPALFVVAAAIELIRRGSTRSARALVAAAGAVVIAANLPVFLAAPDGWRFPLRFQAARAPTWTSLWHLLFSHPGTYARVTASTRAHITNVLVLVALTIAIILVVSRQWRHHLDLTRTGMALTIAFLLTNKVYSPQYDLWLVPFFAMLPVPSALWVAFCGADAAVFLVTFLLLKHAVPYDLAMQWILLASVLLRAGVLIACARWALSPTTNETRHDPIPDLTASLDRS